MADYRTPRTPTINRYLKTNDGEARQRVFEMIRRHANQIAKQVSIPAKWRAQFDREDLASDIFQQALAYIESRRAELSCDVSRRFIEYVRETLKDRKANFFVRLIAKFRTPKRPLLSLDQPPPGDGNSLDIVDTRERAPVDGAEANEVWSCLNTLLKTGVISPEELYVLMEWCRRIEVSIIAIELNRSPGAVRRLLDSALRKLRKVLS